MRKVKHSCWKPRLLINIRLTRMLRWDVVSLNREGVPSICSIISIDHIIQVFWNIFHLDCRIFKILIKFLMEKIIAPRNRFILFWILSQEVETPPLREKGALTQPAIQPDICRRQKSTSCQWKKAYICGSFWWLIENTLLLLFAVLKIMLARIASHLYFPEEIVTFIL